MSDITYIPIIKTTDAELRALKNLSSDVKDKITPLVELTKSRRTKYLEGGDIYRRLRKLEEVFEDRCFILDLTTEPNLINEQIEGLQTTTKGYGKWVTLVTELQEDFPSIIPTIQISDKDVSNEKEYNERLKEQVEALDGKFESLVYRFPADYPDYKHDLDIINEALLISKLIVLMDFGFITQGKAEDNATKAKSLIKELENYSIEKLVLSATSYPKNPTEFGGEDDGTFNLEEVEFYTRVNDNIDKEIVYSDYASIHPVRSDQAGGNGWIPRIDVPTENQIFYHRSRRSNIERTYADAYKRVAQMIVGKKAYRRTKNNVRNCWGIKQIESASEGYPQGLSPSFWISIRMNIYITLRNNLF
ncbi:MAG: beta family protein [Candidatus Aureabacteria bacterium]|nr:beta family protein [Candidatus Auribacterota bacterium]